MILIVCLLILLWLSVSYVRMQRSLRWWQMRQSARQCQEAEGIRDGVLQDAFAMRRSLELALTHPDHCLKPVDPDWLTKIETIQHALEDLSNQLSPLYLDDHLPLAVRSVLEAWQLDQPHLQVETTLPNAWCQGTVEANRIVLMALDELLRLTLPRDRTPMVVQASLQQQEQMQELILHLSAPDLSRVMAGWDAQELKDLRQSFHSLTSGRCYRQNRETPENSSVTWYFRWRSRPNLFPF